MNNRTVVLLADNKHPNYNPANIVIGELILDTDGATLYMKKRNGEIVPVLGKSPEGEALENFVKNSTAFNEGDVSDLNAFLFDTENNLPDPNAESGILKVRMPDGTFKELGIRVDSSNCIIYTGGTTEEGEPEYITLTDMYEDFKTLFDENENASNKSYYFKLNGQRYIRRVIGLGIIPETQNMNHNSFNGTIVSDTGNGFVDTGISNIISIGTRYNDDANSVPVVETRFLSSSVLGQRIEEYDGTLLTSYDVQHKPISFTYMGVSYFGIEIPTEYRDSLSIHGIFNRDINFKPFVVEYENTNTGEILNTEVKNSLVYTGITKSPLDILSNNSGLKHDANVPFIQDEGIKKKGYVYFDITKEGLFKYTADTDEDIRINSGDHFEDISNNALSDKLENLSINRVEYGFIDAPITVSGTYLLNKPIDTTFNFINIKTGHSKDIISNILRIPMKFRNLSYTMIGNGNVNGASEQGTYTFPDDNSVKLTLNNVSGLIQPSIQEIYLSNI